MTNYLPPADLPPEPDAFAQCIDELMHGFRTYDRAVDVVSAFEFLFSQAAELPQTVEHFERFPSLPQEDGDPLAPDFTVVFQDGVGLIAEIARVALHENSVDDLCKQIERYATQDTLPVGSGMRTVEHVDVLLLLPSDVAHPATRRILEERFANEDHFYSPPVAPCIVQFMFDQDRYVFQWLMHELNETPREQGRDGVGAWLVENSIKVRPGRFVGIKSARAFMNDPIDALYLATHLWTKTLATRAGPVRPARIEVGTDELVEALRQQHGRVRTADVRKAMGLLVTAGLVERVDDKEWLVGWDALITPGEKAAERIIATRACKKQRGSGPLARLKAREKEEPETPPKAPTLFDREP